MSKITGNRPTILIVDEMHQFRSSDYAKLEQHLLAHGYGLIHTAFDEKGGIAQEVIDPLNAVYTGRTTQTNPGFQELPGVREEHIKAWGELLHSTFNSPEARQRFKELTFLDRYSMPGMRGSGKTLSVLRDHAVKAGFPEFCGPESVGADHPSRKHEPKGPRGKWGKL